LAGRLIRFPGFPAGTPVEDTWLRVPYEDPDLPGWHRSETLDLMVVIEGALVLGLDDGEHPLSAGDAVVQRGTFHRWRVVGEQPCTFLSVLISPDPAAKGPVAPVIAPEDANLPRDPAARPLRLVTGTDADGRSRVVALGAGGINIPATGPAGAGLADFWLTGGPVASVSQGGDAPPPWQLEPAGRGFAFRRVDFGPQHDPGDAGWHTTETIDIDVILGGALELALDEKGPATMLRKGDVVVQRATPHRWRPVGDEGAILVSVMIGLPGSG
jgi:quercetin dioxygenase-like cupin family protein